MAATTQKANKVWSWSKTKYMEEKKVSVECNIKNNGDGYVWIREQCRKQQEKYRGK